jgi:predicted NACHT family NTPase
MNLKKDFETIKDISAIGQKEAVNLEDIYVSLKLSETVLESDLPIEMENEKIFDEKLIEKRKEKEVKRERVIDPEKALKKFHRMVIVGAPGAGKTTLLKHLALKYCQESIQKQERIIIPIPITLREFFQSDKGIREYIDEVFERYGFSKAKEFVEKDLKTGKCILLLDGFDELAARENQGKVTKEVHNFVNQYHGCRVVVTSRAAGYHNELSGFTQLEVIEFDDQQIKLFIDNWFGETNKNKAQSMLRAVMENGNIKILARNPLMVAIIAIIYEEDRELPQRRVDLYKRAVEVLLSKWDLRKKLKNRFSVDQKEFILRKLAYRNHCRNQRVMSEEKILEEITAYSFRIGLKEEDTRPFLEEIWQRSYILRQISMDAYDFLHLSFQEYFTALELKEQEDGIATI